MEYADVVVIVIGVALGYHGGSILNWAFFTYIIGEDDDQ